MEISVKSYGDLEINLGEVYRYARQGEVTPEIAKLIEECIAEAMGGFSYKVCYGELDVCISGDTVDFGITKVESRDLARNLKGCNRVVIFCATVGLGIDRLINRYGTTSPAKGLIMQAIGAERIESLCNAFNNEIKRKHETVPRLSPGYGDFPLEFQREIFRLLSPDKRIGLMLNESLLMSPTKSVTAIIGLKVQ